MVGRPVAAEHQNGISVSMWHHTQQVAISGSALRKLCIYLFTKGKTGFRERFYKKKKPRVAAGLVSTQNLYVLWVI
jgi:hypothetical protein